MSRLHLLPLPLLLAAAVLVPPRGASAAEPPPSVQRREVGSLVLEGIPEIPVEVRERMAQYQNVRQAVFHDWGPNGEGVLLTTRFGDTAQVHHVARPGGHRRQLTFFREPVRAARFSHDGRGLLLQMDAGGAEAYQIYWHDLGSGRTTLLTDGRSRHDSLLRSRRGDRFAFMGTARNGRDFDLYVVGTGPEEKPKLVRELEGRWSPLDWSPDDRRLLLSRFVSIGESYLSVLDLESGELRPIDPAPGKTIAFLDAAFVDAHTVLFASDLGGEFHRLHRWDLRRGRGEVISPELSWDVVGVEVSRDGRRFAFEVNEGGASVVYLGETARPRGVRRLPLPRGVAGPMQFDPAGRRLGLSLNSATSPEDVWSVDLSGVATRWTFSEVGGLDTARFVEPELVKFASFDGREIPAWYYRPRAPGPPGSRKLPVIIDIHGGPEAQAMAGFNTLAQYRVLELGLAVLYPNVRGSSGYGRTYLSLDDGRRREDAVRDIAALLDWIAARPELDATRVAVYGGSYGGYMVLASLAEFGDRLRCGVDIVGISHFVTFLERTESYRRDLRRAEYGDERDPEMRAFLDRISPLTRANRIVKPLFVAQGQNDPRVPVNEAEQIVRTVRENGGEVWYLLARDEGHGFAKKPNRDFFLNAQTLFFERCLLQ